MFICLQMATPHVCFDIGIIVFYTSGTVLLDRVHSILMFVSAFWSYPSHSFMKRERDGKNTLHWYCFIGKVSGPLSSVWKESVKWCVEFGIQANAIIAVPYDWRLPHCYRKSFTRVSFLFSDYMNIFKGICPIFVSSAMLSLKLMAIWLIYLFIECLFNH